jgi:hypothetical protein
MGKVIPEILNSVPVDDAEETVTLAPLAASDADCAPVVPITTLPKLKELGLAVNCPANVPDPESAIGGTDAVEERVTDPLMVPVACGENETVNDADWPAASVNGTFRPLAVNPVPLTVTVEMLALEPPEFNTTAFCVCEVPTCTLPKLRLLGLIVNAAAETTVPVPLTKTDAVVELRQLFLPANTVMKTDPETDPDAVGANLIESATD